MHLLDILAFDFHLVRIFQANSTPIVVSYPARQCMFTIHQADNRGVIMEESSSGSSHSPTWSRWTGVCLTRNPIVHTTT